MWLANWKLRPSEPISEHSSTCAPVSSSANQAAANVKIAENDGAIQRSHERMKELDSETACSDEKLDAVCEQYADCKALTYELTHAFISAVYIYDLDNIEIVWKFKDFLTTSEGEAK